MALLKGELKGLLLETEKALTLHNAMLTEALRLMEEETVDDIFFVAKIRDEQKLLLSKMKKIES